MQYFRILLWNMYIMVVYDHVTWSTRYCGLIFHRTETIVTKCLSYERFRKVCPQCSTIVHAMEFNRSMCLRKVCPQWSILVNTQVQSHALLCRGFGTSVPFICYSTCVDDVKLVQMRGGTQYRYATCTSEGYNIHLLCNLCKWGLEHSTICYATCANAVELVQMRGGTWYNIFAMQLVWMRLICAVELRGNIELPWQ